MTTTKKSSLKKIENKQESSAVVKLNGCPTSPRKMRLVADLIRGKEVFKALSILQFTPNEAARRLEKLLKSAIASWESKNENQKSDENNLIIKQIKVDSATMLKRIQPAPQGRAHKIRKRSNHVTLTIDKLEV